MNSELIVEIEKYKEQYPENEMILKSIQKSLEDLEGRENQRYSLVFIAEKGAGKTTIINNLMGLWFDKRKYTKMNKPFDAIESVLETGSGATTLSEVEICQKGLGATRIKIIPYETEELVDLLEEFAKSLFNTAHEIESETVIATEVMRACRNITGLIENKKIKEDKGKELALRYSLEDFDVFKERIILLANLEKRKTLDFTYEENGDIEAEKEWIKKIFKKINLVHIDEAPMPKKIIIEINRGIFDFNKFSKIDRIIDTRGLEIGSVTDRSDIKRMFREEKNNIMLFVDKFNSPSKSIIDLLDHYLYDDEMECIDRLGYIVNFRDGEPENVIDCDGTVESEKDGIIEKESQLKQIFKENGVRLKEENIIYTNPGKFLSQEGRVRVEDDDYDIYEADSRNEIIQTKRRLRNEERLDFEKKVIEILDTYDNQIKIEKEQVLKKYNELKTRLDESSLVDFKAIIDEVKDKVLGYDLKEEIDNLYVEYIDGKFPSTLRAINRRFGIYNSTDIYCEGANRIENLIKKEMLKLKADIIGKLTENDKLNENQKELVGFLIKDINNYFYKYIETINEYFYEKLRYKVFAEEEISFWDRLKQRWGRGAGYRKDINRYYKEMIIYKKFGEEFNEEIENLLKIFKEGLIEIIEKNMM